MPDMASAVASSTIAEEVKLLLRKFETLIDACSKYTTEKGFETDFKAKFEDEFDRFKLWAGNIGAHRHGESSLDYRLRDASNIQQRVFQLLAELHDATVEAYQIVSGERTPWDERSDSDNEMDDPDADDTEQEYGPSTGSELEQIRAHVEETTRCLLRLSMTIQNPAPHDRFLKAASTNTSYYEPHDIQHVRTKFPEASSYLIERLGKAISWRRQFIKYSEAHRSRYKSGLTNIDDGKSTVASSLPPVIKLGAHEFDNLDALSQTSFATSLADDSKLKAPPLPADVEYNDEFECPLCYCIVSFPNWNAWKRHVFNDLQPYTCLFENCTTPHKAFTTRHSWQSHLENHPYPDDVCPLCQKPFQSVRQWRSHVGKEMQQLALFSIPKELYGSGKDQDDDEDGLCRSEHSSEALEFKEGSQEALDTNTLDDEVVFDPDYFKKKKEKMSQNEIDGSEHDSEAPVSKYAKYGKIIDTVGVASADLQLAREEEDRIREEERIRDQLSDLDRVRDPKSTSDGELVRKAERRLAQLEEELHSDVDLSDRFELREALSRREAILRRLKDRFEQDHEKERILAKRENEEADAGIEPARTLLEMELIELEEDMKHRALVAQNMTGGIARKNKQEATDQVVAAWEKRKSDDMVREEALKWKLHLEEEQKKKKEKEKKEEWIRELEKQVQDAQDDRKKNEEELEIEMYKKLAAFGFAENQIEAGLDAYKEKSDDKATEEALKEKFNFEETRKRRKEEAGENEFIRKPEKQAQDAKSDKKKKEIELEIEMHKKLAAFGFQDNQIEAVLNPKKADELQEGSTPLSSRPARDPRKDAPTYIKVHETHVDIETLRYFDLPWEYDAMDTNYIIILQELDKYQTQLLFEHTRKLRRGGSQLLIEDRGRENESQYAFVRRRKSSVSPVRGRRSESKARMRLF